MHELSHQFGTVDHYCKDDGDPCSNKYCDICVLGNPEVRHCIMSGHDVDINVELADENALYCESCFETINNHLSSHHKQQEDS